MMDAPRNLKKAEKASKEQRVKEKKSKKEMGVKEKKIKAEMAKKAEIKHNLSGVWVKSRLIFSNVD
jgi:hypothetical protein